MGEWKMKKALEILTSYGHLIAEKTPITANEIEEAIDELRGKESCEGCKFMPEKGGSYPEQCIDCRRWYGDNHTKML